MVAFYQSWALLAALSGLLVVVVGGAKRMQKWEGDSGEEEDAVSAPDLAAANAHLSVNISTPRGELGSLLFGIFFEEINHAGDGGLYAEMIQNRAFGEDIHGLPGNVSLYHSFASVANGSEGAFLRHCRYQGYTTTIQSQIDMQDSTFGFATIPGHAAATNSISLVSLNFPGYYLAVEPQNLSLVLGKNDGSEAFAQHATFTKVPGLTDPNDPNLMSFIWTNGNANYYMAQTPTCYGGCSGGFPGCHRVNFVHSPQADTATFRIREANVLQNQLGWSGVGTAGLEITTVQPLNKFLNRSLHISCPSGSDVETAETTACGVANLGYWGMNVMVDQSYNVSFFATAVDGATAPKEVMASLVADGTVLGLCTLQLGGSVVTSWQRQFCTIKSNGTYDKSELWITFTGGDLLINVVSVMPSDLEGGHPFRKDLLDKLKAINPAFVRFPGGCYVEGDKLEDAFRWRNSIGPIHERPGHYNLWGYWSDDGLGFYEYLILCEILGAEPVWVINNGISHTDEIATADIGPWVQDALDSLEFANGPAESYYGGIRAVMGHTEPFNVRIMAIGNEDCGKPSYQGNYMEFYKAIKIRYPDMRLIANCDLSAHNPSSPTDIYDYHIYTGSSTFFTGADRFDTFDRNGPLIFNSEYAITSDAGLGNLRAAVAEAAWMTGLERNSDIVMMASYAPLFVNVNDRRWKVDAIVYNASVSYGTPSYWNQVMFASTARQASFLNYFELNVTTSTGSYIRRHREVHHRRHDNSLADTPQTAASVTMSEVAKGRRKVFVKVANWGTAAELTTNLADMQGGKVEQAELSQMQGSDPVAENTLENPTSLSPVSSPATISGNSTVTISLPQWSVSVLTITVSHP